MSYYYYSLKEAEVEVDLHYRTKLLVIQTIKDCHFRKIPCVKFITRRGNHVNATGEREVLYEDFPSWMLDNEIRHLIEQCQKYDGYYLVYLDLNHAPSLFRRLIFGFRPPGWFGQKY
ncbi:hypothetical protein GLOIN_2v1765901 [Rhizophagus irregularis DAOM 181602=DAOM 197198]|uniref:Smr domain-containing protein n=1 Tax=Rhizophagus irregularis (strain DAOM 181602 / DAOM 197198 / MUCL 43194) TaxID=747089 RepID=A0A2P4QN95_RHIID|nr:hypothetical protein GLOIN_2v1765901 [Rhizophagus irregularis DAOM 181602=DAOM 197198]POG79100.1 hypothetical protein GLOIN_2v1765901 [Rhizophagus irregularis DAOM 181602=DAOM 197198]GET54010.1 hypothetical protein GLOIN_2v1765901 [Rhizophagus irregularis DAOM 181602=DAOM 197198]|eukprot:XP_025185966.1 hypothetical protein GLOIN_2v1765901 [Rhizophagus irregularis DAOM 181602=DAOM 197198]